MGSEIQYIKEKKLFINNQTCLKFKHDESHIPRNEHCANLVNNQFGIAITSEYITKYFNNNDLNKVILINFLNFLKVKELIYSIINALKLRINNYKWIDIVTREKTIKKVKSIF